MKGRNPATVIRLTLNMLETWNKKIKMRLITLINKG